MSDYALAQDWPDAIAFKRLHALVGSGYKARLGVESNDRGFARIDLFHPRTSGDSIPPHLTLWSNGIVVTSQLLWPSHHVPAEDGFVPEWQKYIDVTDGDLFRSFVLSIPTPNVYDLYIAKSLQHAKILLKHFVLALSLCLIAAATLLLIGHFVVK